MSRNLSDIEKLTSMNREEYLHKRLDEQIRWYDRKSGINKKLFFALQIVVLLASALVPVLSGISGEECMRIVIGALGSSIAVITGIVSLCQCRDLWIEYRVMSESLKYEKFLFVTGTVPYNDKNAFPRLVNTVESLIRKENIHWQLRHKKPTEDPGVRDNED